MSLTLPSVDTLVSELADELGEDAADTDVTTRIKRWLNDTFEDIASRTNDWKWARDYRHLVLNPAYSDGSVTFTNGVTTVTGVGTAFDTSWTNRVIWLSGGSVLYKVVSVTSATSLELEIPYQESTSAAAAYYLVQNRYPLDNSAYESGIICVVDPYTNKELNELSVNEFLSIYPKLTEFGNPTGYLVFGQEESGQVNATAPLIYFNKYPTTAKAFTYWFHKQMDRIDGTQTFPIQHRLARLVLMAGARLRSGRFDNENLDNIRSEYEGYIRLMLRDNSKSGKRQRYLKETDIPVSQSDSARLPSNYPKIWGL